MFDQRWVVKFCIQAKWPIRQELIPVSVVNYISTLPPPSQDWMLVHHRVNPSIKFGGAHLYAWVERGTVRVKCLGQDHNTVGSIQGGVHQP